MYITGSTDMVCNFMVIPCFTIQNKTKCVINSGYVKKLKLLYTGIEVKTFFGKPSIVKFLKNDFRRKVHGSLIPTVYVFS